MLEDIEKTGNFPYGMNGDDMKILDHFRPRLKGLRATMALPRQQLLLIFGIEGILYQFAQSVNNFGNNLYARGLGATDTQIGLVQTVPNVLALILMLPCGIISDRLRRSRTVPVACLTIMGIMYFFYGSVPMFGALRMSLFFVFLGMTVASAVLYNAQWQNFFGDVTPQGDRNGVLAFRSRIMFFIGVLTPLLCGAFMASRQTADEKLVVLRIFYYICGVFVLLQALAIRRIPCPERTEKAERFSPALVGQACRDAFGSRYFRRFFVTGILFYATWQLDWSMWFIQETQYANMTESHLSIMNAVTCIAQVATIGVYSRLIQKKSVYFAMIFVEIGYILGAPFALLAMSPLFSAAAKPWAFIAGAIIPSALECAFNLCLVQMMLASTPHRNRSLIISLYTMVTTTSNAVVPLLGVKLYTVLGADWGAVLKFDSILIALRFVSLIEIIWLFFVTRKEGRLFATDPD